MSYSKLVDKADFVICTLLPQGTYLNVNGIVGGVKHLHKVIGSEAFTAAPETEMAKFLKQLAGEGFQYFYPIARVLTYADGTKHFAVSCFKLKAGVKHTDEVLDQSMDEFVKQHARRL